MQFKDFRRRRVFYDAQFWPLLQLVSVLNQVKPISGMTRAAFLQLTHFLFKNPLQTYLNSLFGPFDLILRCRRHPFDFLRSMGGFEPNLMFLESIESFTMLLFGSSFYLEAM